jgi:hypothetical protein
MHDTGVCFSNKLVVVVLDDWEVLGSLNSMIHEVWYRKQGTGMKQDSSYMPTACYETFPLSLPSDAVKMLGREFDSACAETARSRQLGLTPLWNLVNSPDCVDDDVARLRQLRERLTIAVAEAYGMTIDFRFGHYKDHADRWRHAMHPEASEQVYLRLVELNAEQAAGVPTKPTTKLAKGQAKLTGGQRRLPSE